MSFTIYQRDFISFSYIIFVPIKALTGFVLLDMRTCEVLLRDTKLESTA